MELEVDGEKVMVEKFTEEDWKELCEREKKENLSIECITTHFIFLEKEERENPEVVFQRMALAAYRLLWYFGPPLPISHIPPRSVYAFSLKYKGYIFDIHDDLSGRALAIYSVHLAPKGEEFDKQKYIPPKEIREEIKSIIKHLVMTPAEMYAGDYYVSV
ncbi:MAG: hypothetical protein QXI42_06240 [Thermoproteota archaeon]|nr:hypothetical protein [Candidatus Brockarchaeota archaeon]